MVTSKRTEGSADHLSAPLLVFKQSDKSYRVVVRGLLSTYLRSLVLLASCQYL